MKDWTLSNEPDAQHVVPNDDLILHVKSEACTCHPVVHQIGFTCHDHGGSGTLAVRRQVAHNAMDGRE